MWLQSHMPASLLRAAQRSEPPRWLCTHPEVTRNWHTWEEKSCCAILRLCSSLPNRSPRENQWQHWDPPDGDPYHPAEVRNNVLFGQVAQPQHLSSKRAARCSVWIQDPVTIQIKAQAEKHHFEFQECTLRDRLTEFLNWWAAPESETGWATFGATSRSKAGRKPSQALG
jgi:hypothetical protein